MGFERALDELIAFLVARDDADANVAPAMRSTVVRGAPGRGAIVLLHGLTASPPAWRGLAPVLAAHGHTVVVPRLHLHGYADRMTGALRSLHPDALIDDVAGMLERVAALGESLTVAGHSLGATLAIDAASRMPEVERIVAVAPFLGIARVSRHLHRLLAATIGLVPDTFLWWNPVARENLQPAHGYPRYPLRAIATGLAIADAALAGAATPPHARAIDLVLNARETSVNNRTALHLAGAWRAAGASVAVHRLRGLTWSHDIIEPARSVAGDAAATLVQIIERAHVGTDRDYVI